MTNEPIRADAPKGFRVKPLVWNEYDTNGSAYCADAEVGSFGVFYSIEVQRDGYRVVFDHEAVRAIGVFENLDDATAAAQTDYEARIMSALEPADDDDNDATIVDRNLLHRMRTRASWQDCHDGALTIEGQANTIARLSADLDQVSADRDGMGEVVKTGREVMSIWKGRAEKAEARVKLLEAAVDHWKTIAQKEGR